MQSGDNRQEKAVIDVIMSIDTSRPATSVDYNKAEQQKWEPIYAKDRVFPRVEHGNITSELQTWYMNEAYRDLQYSRYVNELGYRRAMNLYLGGHGANPGLINFLSDVIHKKESVRVGGSGDSRSGKSFFFHGLIRVHAEMLKKNIRFHLNVKKPDDFYLWDVNGFYNRRQQKINPNFTPETWSSEPIDDYIAYNRSQMLNVLDRVKAHDWVHGDEWEKQSGEMSRTAYDALNNILNESSGAEQINFIITNPTFVYMDSLQYYFDMLGYKEKTNMSRAMMYRAEGPSISQRIYKGVVEINTWKPAGLMKAYKQYTRQKKKQFLKDLGLSGVDIDEETFDELVQELIEAWTKQGYSKVTVDDVELVAMKTPRVKRSLARKYIMREAYLKLKKRDDARIDDGNTSIDVPKEGNLRLVLDQPDPFVLHDAELLKDWPGNKDHVEIYMRHVHGGETQASLGKEFNIEQYNISRQVISPSNPDDTSKIPGWLAQERGNRYEDHLEEVYKQRYGPLIEKIYHEKDPKARIGERDIRIDFKPKKTLLNALLKEKLEANAKASDFTMDLYDEMSSIMNVDAGDIHVISVKCMSSPDGDPRKTYSLPIKEFNPEIKLARKLKRKHPDKDVRLYIHALNMYHHLSGEFLIDIDNLPKGVSITIGNGADDASSSTGDQDETPGNDDPGNTENEGTGPMVPYRAVFLRDYGLDVSEQDIIDYMNHEKTMKDLQEISNKRKKG